MTEVDLKAVVDLTAAEEAARSTLTLAVYPPGAASTPGEELTWAAPQWAVLVWEGEQLVSHVGIVIRDATLDGQPVRIGGIGSVKTHPAMRGRGHAGLAMDRAVDFFRAVDPPLAFALLVCREPLISYYGRFGWHLFAETMFVEQPGGAVPFTANRVMTSPVHEAAPQDGTIDLRGLPW